jgi:hypothetical protein
MSKEETGFRKLAGDLLADQGRRFREDHPELVEGPDCPALYLFIPSLRRRDWNEQELAHFQSGCPVCRRRLESEKRLETEQEVVDKTLLSPVVVPAAEEQLPAACLRPNWADAERFEFARAHTADEPDVQAHVQFEEPSGEPLRGRVQVFVCERGRPSARPLEVQPDYLLRLCFLQLDNRPAERGGVSLLARFNQSLFEVSYARPGLLKRLVRLHVAFNDHGDLASIKTPIQLDGPPSAYHFRVRWISPAGNPSQAASRPLPVPGSEKILPLVRV